MIDETPIGTLLFVAFSRWQIEKTFKESKNRVGYDHFEVRTYLAVTRHLILSTISLLFLVEQSLRLRKKAPGWTIPQVREAIKVQLDAEMSHKERRRLLENVIHKVKYYQRRSAVASKSHKKTQRKKLRTVEVDLRSAIRCPTPWEKVA